MNTIAYRLRLLRESKGMSQREVAEHIGMSRAAYNKYERGASRPVRRLRELSELFGVSMDYIMGRNETPLEQNMRLDADCHFYEQVSKYLRLSDHGRHVVDITLDAVYEGERRARKK